MRAIALLSLLFACNPPDVEDDPLPTDTTLERVGSDVLQFYGRVPKNLIFLSIDTFRKDHVGAHGNKDLTPFLDRIASQGVVMEDHAQCANWTFGSTTCTLAGRYNIERGHIPRLNGTDATRPKVPDGTPFLATWLGQAGYYSVIVSGNDWLSDNWGNTQGYDEMLRPGGSALAVQSTATRAMKDAIARGDAERWFMHMHFMEPHASYDPPAANIEGRDALDPWPEDLTNRDMHYDARDEWPSMSEAERQLLEAHLRALYEGEIRTIDERLEQAWDDLEKEGYLDDTLVVIWNDHGEQFWEHGHQTHAYQLFGEENDGFLMFWSRNIVPGRYKEPTSTIDLVPTILDLFDLPIPDEVSGLPIGTAPADRPRFAEALARMGGVQTVQRDGLKLHFVWSGNVTFYDRNTDPKETTDLYDPTDPRVLELWSLLKPMAEKMAPLVVGGIPQPNFPDELP